MKSGKITVKTVLPGSIAEEAGMQPGDGIISINNEKIGDVFDYRFLITNRNVVLKFQKKNGRLWETDIEKEEYEDLGIEFENPMIDEEKCCANKCIFCFIDQLPAGMRSTLYFKDDDARLSFLTGNYITLTNMGYNDIDRIIKYKMSPVNISVHTTNPDLRVFMMKNRFAGDLMKKIKRLAHGEITLNCQIVLCRGVNDGDELDRTISELSDFYPGVKSISVVPVGITRHRKGLYDLMPYDKKSSTAVVLQVEEWQKKMLNKYGSRVVYPADEFYIMAEMQMPDYECYEDFPQLENGVGLIAELKHEFNEYLEELEEKWKGAWKREDGRRRHVSIATGISAYEYIKEMADILGGKCNNLKINVYKIKNVFFGENVTVAGLLTGKDIVSQLAGKDLGDELLISRSMLKSGADLLLDDLTVGMLEKQLNVRVTPVENNGGDFTNKILAVKN